MEAIFVKDLHEKPILTTITSVQAFADCKPAGLVGEALCEVYRLAVRGDLREEGLPVSAEEVASLFDQLIVLALALLAWRGHWGGARYLGVVVEGGTADV